MGKDWKAMDGKSCIKVQKSLQLSTTANCKILVKVNNKCNKIKAKKGRKILARAQAVAPRMN